MYSPSLIVLKWYRNSDSKELLFLTVLQPWDWTGNTIYSALNISPVKSVITKSVGEKKYSGETQNNSSRAQEPCNPRTSAHDLGWRTSWWLVIKITGLINIPHDAAIPLLGIHPEETKTEKDTRTPMFTAALFTVAGAWKQHRCPLVNEWKRKLWYIYTME